MAPRNDIVPEAARRSAVWETPDGRHRYVLRQLFSPYTIRADSRYLEPKQMQVRMKIIEDELLRRNVSTVRIVAIYLDPRMTSMYIDHDVIYPDEVRTVNVGGKMEGRAEVHFPDRQVVPCHIVPALPTKKSWGLFVQNTGHKNAGVLAQMIGEVPRPKSR